MEIATLILDANKLCEEAHKAYHAGHQDEAVGKMQQLLKLMTESAISNSDLRTNDPDGDAQDTPQQPEEPT